MDLLKVSEYPIVSTWYVTGMTKPGWKWRYIPNMLQLNVTQYIELLKKYNAIKIRYYAPTDCLLYAFKNQADAHKWVLYVNREARKRNYCW